MDFLNILDHITSITGNAALIAFFFLRERLIRVEVNQQHYNDNQVEIKEDLKEIKKILTQIQIEK